MANESSVSVLLVDDHAEFRQGLRTLLSFYTDGGTPFDVVAEAASVEQAFSMIQSHSPMVTLLDMELDQGSGLEVLQQLNSLDADTRVLTLSAHREDEWIFQAMQAGAKGYVAKDKVATQLHEALHTILKNEIYLDPQLASGFFRQFQRQSEQVRQDCEEIRLTEREQDVLNCLVQGYSNSKIAQELFITVATVKAHLTAIFDKFSVSSRTEAIVKAIKLGLAQT